MSENYPPLFIDTGAWIALNEKKDTYHEKARKFIEKNKKDELNFGPVHTSEMVLQETYTFLLYNYNYEAAVEIIDYILDSEVIIHPFSSLNFEEIWDGINDEKKDLSFVDWSTMVYMDRYHIEHIFTFDGDFGDVGYNVMP